MTADARSEARCGMCGRWINLNASEHITTPDGHIIGIECAAKAIPHRIVNVATRSCLCCGKFLHDCVCPTGVKCEYCELDPEDAIYTNPVRCTDPDSEDGEHKWMDDHGNTIIVGEWIDAEARAYDEASHGGAW